MSEQFVCHYYLVTNRGFSRSPFSRRDEVEAAGGKFAKESLVEIEAVLGGKFASGIRWGRADVWFPNYPQIVISTNQRSCYIWGLIKDSKTSDISKYRILELDIGEWGLIGGRPFFITHNKIFPDWVGDGPWPFLEMYFPNLPMVI